MVDEQPWAGWGQEGAGLSSAGAAFASLFPFICPQRLKWLQGSELTLGAALQGQGGELATSDSEGGSSWQREQVEGCRVPPRHGSASPSGAPTHTAPVCVPGLIRHEQRMQRLLQAPE